MCGTSKQITAISIQEEIETRKNCIKENEYLILKNQELNEDHKKKIKELERLKYIVIPDPLTPAEELLKEISGVKNLIKNSCYGIEKQRQKVINANQNKILSEKKLHKKICQWDRLEKQLSEYESEYAKMVNNK